MRLWRARVGGLVVMFLDWIGGYRFLGEVSLFTFFDDGLAVDFLAFILRCEDLDIDAFL